MIPGRARVNIGAGATWFITPMIAPYIEASFLLPIKNEVQLSSGVGKVRYDSDFDDGSRIVLDEIDRGFAFASSMRSLTEFAATEGCAAITYEK